MESHSNPCVSEGSGENTTLGIELLPDISTEGLPRASTGVSIELAPVVDIHTRIESRRISGLAILASPCPASRPRPLVHECQTRHEQAGRR